MKVTLDVLTLERVARLICDIGGPYEKTGMEIENFLRRARWPEPAPYDGSSRIPWLIETLTASSAGSATPWSTRTD
jgi:hypothetical protein